MVVIVTLVALGVVSWSLVATFGSPLGSIPTALPPSGLTFSQPGVLSNSTAASASGEPWTLISGQGIVVASAPASVQPLSDPDTAYCQALPGPNVWNTSGIPVSSVPLDSGRAPFWAMTYLNTTNYGLQVILVQQGNSITVNTVGPLSPSSPCGRVLQAGFGVNQPQVWPPNEAWEYDSSTASELAWQWIGQSFASQNPTLELLYSFGNTPFAIAGDNAGWNLVYDSCPFEHSTWIHPAASANVLGHGPSFHVTGNYTYGCWPYRNNITFGTWQSSPDDLGGRLFASSLVSGVNWGLIAWMTQLWVNSSAGAPEPLVGVACNSSDMGPQTCSPLGSGWFAVLRSTSGGWLDVYSSVNGTGTWQVPNVTIYTNDSLAVYIPTGLTPSNLQLTLGETEPAVNVTAPTTVL